MYMSDERYLAALKRQRDLIASGYRFSAVDSNAPGDKFTEASWGLCSGERESWPDAEDHLWPEQFEKHGRIAPKYRSQHQACPMQRKGGGSGCFFHCRIFKGREITENKRDEAVALYDAAIAKATA
jgi:hypothetical protein